MADKIDFFEIKSTGDTPKADATKNTTPAQESAPSNEAKPRRSRRSAAKGKNPEGDVAPVAQGAAASTGTPEGATASDINYKDTPIGQAVMLNDFAVDLARQKNQVANGHMRHTIALSFLQEEEFSEEREAFYAKIYETTGKPVSVEDGENYIAKLMDPWDGHPLLREAAPKACLAAEDYIANTNVDGTLKGAGYSAARLSPEFKQQMQLTQAYANRIGGKEGHKGFVATLKEYQESFQKGMVDPKVGLAISGAMLGMGVMLGAGPAGLAIGAVKCAHKLLETPTGQKFQKRLSESVSNFLEKMGVDPAVLDKMTRSVQQIAENKWTKRLSRIGGLTAVALTGVGLISAVDEWIVKLPGSGGTGVGGVTPGGYTPATPDVGSVGMDGATSGGATPTSHADVGGSAADASGTPEKPSTATYDAGPDSSSEGSAVTDPAGPEKTSTATHDTGPDSSSEGSVVTDSAGPEKPSTATHDTSPDSSREGSAVTDPAGAPDKTSAGPHATESDLSRGDSCESSTAPSPVTVQPGQTLWGIAKEQYQLAHPGEAPNDKQIINMVNEIATQNGIENPNMIFSGQSIQIPQDMVPSSEAISGPIDWLGKDANASSRISGLEERIPEWKEENRGPEPSPLLGTMPETMRV